MAEVSVNDEYITGRCALYHADTIEVARGIPSDSVGLSVYSPPFVSLYVFSDSERDLGNVTDPKDFWKGYRFLIAEAFRVMKPGGIIAVHCWDQPTSKEKDGVIGLYDFPGDIIREHIAAGFVFHSRHAIWKCPVQAVTRTKALGLLHKTIKTDSSRSRMGIMDYMVVFRKPGDRVPPLTNTAEAFPVEQWQHWASPVWVKSEETADEQGFARAFQDINPSDTLNYREARDERDERHVAPLQLEVIRRCVRLWSHPTDTVWSPFAGIGSEGYVALQEGRRFVGAELKDTYFAQAVKNLEAAVVPPKQTSIFDLAGVGT